MKAVVLEKFAEMPAISASAVHLDVRSGAFQGLGIVMEHPKAGITGATNELARNVRLVAVVVDEVL